MDKAPTSGQSIDADKSQFSITALVGAQLRALRIKQVIAKSGMCRSAIYAKAASGDFPAPFKLGNSRASAWWEHEIDSWLLGQLSAQAKDRLASNKVDEHAAVSRKSSGGK